VSDHVTMINHGKIVFSAPLDAIKATHRYVTLRFAEARTRPPELAGVLAWAGAGHEWTAVFHGQLGDMQAAAATCGAQLLDKRVPSLDEIFVARVGSRISATVED
jgi:ABC-2 type transport system ATP-binding protein